MTHTAEDTVGLCIFKGHGAVTWIEEDSSGQSTVSYFEQLALNELKMDRAFVQFKGLDSGEDLLVQCTLDLRHDFALRDAVA